MTEYHRIRCDCFHFSNEVLNLSKKILAKGDGITQWKVFEQFLTSYTANDTQDIQVFLEECNSDKVFTTSCSIKICSVLAHKLDEFRCGGMALSTLLVDFTTILNYNFCSRFYVHRVWDFENSTSLSRELESLRVISSFRCSWNRNSGHGIGNSFMELLLNFGFLPTFRDDCPHLKELLVSIFYYLAMVLLDDMYDETDAYLNNVENVKNEAIKLVKDTLSQHVGGEINKRIVFAGEAVIAILLNFSSGNTVAEWYISRLSMYFTGTRDVFLSVFEVRTVLYICLKLTTKLHLFNAYCEVFDSLMPKCPAKIEPRSLSHLARCQVRQNLSASRLPLPSAVEKLHLPKILKSYILGEVFDITRKNKDVTSQDFLTQTELALLISKT